MTHLPLSLRTSPRPRRDWAAATVPLDRFWGLRSTSCGPVQVILVIQHSSLFFVFPCFGSGWSAPILSSAHLSIHGGREAEGGFCRILSWYCNLFPAFFPLSLFGSLFLVSNLPFILWLQAIVSGSKLVFCWVGDRNALNLYDRDGRQIPFAKVVPFLCFLNPLSFRKLRGSNCCSLFPVSITGGRLS